MKIHLISKNGMFEVEQYDEHFIKCSTKYTNFQVPVNDFKCFAKGMWNTELTVEETDKFLSVVNPERYEELQLQNTRFLESIEILKKPEDYAKSHYYEEEERERYLEDEELDYEYLTISNEQLEVWWRKSTDEDKSYRFCFDPYGFVTNGHSDISDLYDDGFHGTINGGWIKVIKKSVILYYKSGDYGVYDDLIATKCTTTTFTNKEIYSFAGKEWKEVEKLL